MDLKKHIRTILVFVFLSLKKIVLTLSRFRLLRLSSVQFVLLMIPTALLSTLSSSFVLHLVAIVVLMGFIIYRYRFLNGSRHFFYIKMSSVLVLLGFIESFVLHVFKAPAPLNVFLLLSLLAWGGFLLFSFVTHLKDVKKALFYLEWLR